MSTVTVSLSDVLKDWVEARARSRCFGDAGDYLRDLIQRDQERTERIDALQKLITEGIDSGISERSPIEVLQLARDRVLETRKP